MYCVALFQHKSIIIIIDSVIADACANASDIKNVQASVNRELLGVDNWLKTNRLSLNVNKTLFLIIYHQKHVSDIKFETIALRKF